MLATTDYADWADPTRGYSYNEPNELSVEILPQKVVASGRKQWNPFSATVNKQYICEMAANASAIGLVAVPVNATATATAGTTSPFAATVSNNTYGGSRISFSAASPSQVYTALSAAAAFSAIFVMLV